MSARTTPVALVARRVWPGVLAGVLVAVGVSQLAAGDELGVVLFGAAAYVGLAELERRAAYRAGYRRGLITAADAAAELHAGRRRVGQLGIPAAADVDPDDGWSKP